MNGEEKQEERELFYLEPFLKRMDITPEQIERGENPPDFYIMRGAHKIAQIMLVFCFWCRKNE